MPHHRFASRRLVLAPAAVLLASALLAACGSGGSTSSTASNPTVESTNAIVIQNFAFTPAIDTVKSGTTVTVTNKDSVTHTLTAVAPHDKVFNTGLLVAGASRTFKVPDQAGTYPYVCLIHQFMHGTLVVTP